MKVLQGSFGVDRRAVEVVCGSTVREDFAPGYLVVTEFYYTLLSGYKLCSSLAQ